MTALKIYKNKKLLNTWARNKKNLTGIKEPNRISLNKKYNP